MKCFIFIQSEGLACNLAAGEYVIRSLCERHGIKAIALYVSFLRIDYIPLFERITSNTSC